MGGYTLMPSGGDCDYGTVQECQGTEEMEVCGDGWKMTDTRMVCAHTRQMPCIKIIVHLTLVIPVFEFTPLYVLLA